MTHAHILIAGIGNIFRGDDGFGVEVARRLEAVALPEEVRVVDVGVRGFDLAYALAGGDETAILVDAVGRGEAPGTLYVIEADLDHLSDLPGEAIDTHGMHPLQVLHLVNALGGHAGRMLVVGCEPASIGSDDDWFVGLSPPVEAAVDEAVQLIESLIARLREDERAGGQPGRPAAVQTEQVRRLPR